MFVYVYVTQIHLIISPYFKLYIKPLERTGECTYSDLVTLMVEVTESHITCNSYITFRFRQTRAKIPVLVFAL